MMEDLDYLNSVIDTVWTRYGDAPERMPEVVRQFWLVQYLKACVDNGGLVGFLINPSGDEAADTILALKCLGADHAHGQLVKACSIFPGEIAPSDQFERQESIEKRDDLDAWWDVLDEEFYADPDKLDALMLHWVEAHSDVFPTVDRDVT